MAAVKATYTGRKAPIFKQLPMRRNQILLVEPCSDAMISRAKGKHCPHLGRWPARAYAEDGHEAPERTAARTSFSRLALQTQTNMLSRSEEHTSELQSLMRISYAVFCLQKKNNHLLVTTILAVEKVKQRQ